MDSMDQLSNEHKYDLVLHPPKITTRGYGRAPVPVVNIPSSGYILDLVVVYDTSMVDEFGSSGAVTRYF